jgi:hypothetical protein
MTHRQPSVALDKHSIQYRDGREVIVIHDSPPAQPSTITAMSLDATPPTATLKWTPRLTRSMFKRDRDGALLSSGQSAQATSAVMPTPAAQQVPLPPTPERSNIVQPSQSSASHRK